MLTGKRILITGGTGSLGKVLLRRILSGEVGLPERVTVFSRDEAKQHFLRLAYRQRPTATDEVIYNTSREVLSFRIGDVRNPVAVAGALRDVDVVFNAAALKQVPSCEYFPEEAVATNVGGARNIVEAIRAHNLPVETVVGISTDKAVKPVNVMGMTKAIQERIFTTGNLDCPATRFVVVRYGNVMASRGSVIPLFHDQIRSGGPVTITDPRMTRFLLTLDDAVDLIFAAVAQARPGETFIPRVPAALMTDVAAALIDGRPEGMPAVDTVITGIRPGEKIHEILVSEEESQRLVRRGAYYVVRPVLPELNRPLPPGDVVVGDMVEYSSAANLSDRAGVAALLRAKKLMIGDAPVLDGELLR